MLHRAEGKIRRAGIRRVQQQIHRGDKARAQARTMIGDGIVLLAGQGIGGKGQHPKRPRDTSRRVQRGGGMAYVTHNPPREGKPVGTVIEQFPGAGLQLRWRLQQDRPLRIEPLITVLGKTVSNSRIPNCCRNRVTSRRLGKGRD